MSVSKKMILSPHWIIVNWKKLSIWKKPYLSYEEAHRELGLQAINHPQHDWIIEKRETFVEVDDMANSDGFEKF